VSALGHHAIIKSTGRHTCRCRTGIGPMVNEQSARAHLITSARSGLSTEPTWRAGRIECHQMSLNQHRTEITAMDLTVCPECAEPAEVQWRSVLESTDGPVEHAKIICARRHWFLVPVAAPSSISN
jgi:uncharacterized protein YbaR (Trm112 family)